MSRRPKNIGGGPNVVQFRPRPKSPKVPPRWLRSVKLFAILLAAVGATRALYTGMAFGWFDLLFVVLLAGALALADLLGKRA